MRLSQQACPLKSTLSGDDVFELNRFLVIELRLAHKLLRKKDINDHFVRIEDISPKVFTIYFLMNCSGHVTEKSQ